MATYLRLTGVQAVTGGELNLNGTNTGMASITLLPGWRPRVGPRRGSVLGNKPVHDDVVENVPLRIHGTTEAECITALEALAAAVEQARVWRRGIYNTTSLKLNYKINGSVLTNPLLAAVLDSPANAEDILELPVLFNQEIQVFEVNPTTLPLLRVGAWLGDEETQTPTVVESSRRMSVVFTNSAVLPSPTELECSVEDSDIFTSGLDIPASFILTAPREAAGVRQGLILEDANGISPDANYSAVVEGGTQSNSGTILRFTPPDTDPHLGDLGVSGATGIDLDARLFAIYANMRSNISAVTWFVSGIVGRGNLLPQAYARTTPIAVPGDDVLEPKWRFLGLVSYPTNILAAGVEISASTTTGSPVLDFDQLAIQAVDSPASTAIVVNDFSVGAGSSASLDLQIRHRFLDRPLPTLSLSNGTFPSFAGNLTPQISGTHFDFAWLATSGANWRWYDANAASIISHTLTATRRPAYLIPR